MVFDKKIILEGSSTMVTLVKDESTETCSIGVSAGGGKPSCKFISEELYDMLIEELLNQSSF